MVPMDENRELYQNILILQYSLGVLIGSHTVYYFFQKCIIIYCILMLNMHFYLRDTGKGKILLIILYQIFKNIFTDPLLLKLSLLIVFLPNHPTSPGPFS